MMFSRRFLVVAALAASCVAALFAASITPRSNQALFVSRSLKANIAHSVPVGGHTHRASDAPGFGLHASSEIQSMPTTSGGPIPSGLLAPIAGLQAVVLAAVSVVLVFAAAVSRGGAASRLDPLSELNLPLMMAAVGGVARRVAVTGAGGRTGRLVLEKLRQSPSIEPVAVVRNGGKTVEAVRRVGVSDADIRIADVTGDVKTLTEAFAGCDAVILCTSAVPRIDPLSLVTAFFTKCLLRKPARPTFTFPPGGLPEEVDWIGAKNQIDAAKAAGVTHFVMVSSMGGTQPDNFLNTIGKKSDGSGGDILLWKRRAERYLIASGMQYTIVHPGGLLDAPGGNRELVFGVDDKLLGEKVRSVPRADVATVCVQALFHSGALNRSFDLISKPEGEGQPTKDFATFFANTGDCDYSL